MPVHDLSAAREFYGGVLGCEDGRGAWWVDFDLYGHQFVTHLASRRALSVRNEVDGDAVPVPHFGRVSTRRTGAGSPTGWRGGVEFVIEPHTRFAGEVGEQSTMFLLDPSGNALEFKAFADDRQVFAA